MDIKNNDPLKVDDWIFYVVQTFAIYNYCKDNLKQKIVSLIYIDDNTLFTAFCVQAVANIADGLDQMAIRTQLLTQCTDIHIHCAGFQQIISIPHFL